MLSDLNTFSSSFYRTHSLVRVNHLHFLERAMLSRPLYMLLSLLERPFYSCCPCHLAESSSSLRFPLRGQLLQEAFSSGDLSPGMCSSYFLWIRTQHLSFPLGNHSLPHSNPWCSGMGSYFTGELGQSAYSILLATGIVF